MRPGWSRRGLLEATRRSAAELRRSGLLCGRRHRLAALALRRLVSGDVRLRLILVGLRFLGFLVALDLTLRHGFLRYDGSMTTIADFRARRERSWRRSVSDQ